MAKAVPAGPFWFRDDKMIYSKTMLADPLRRRRLLKLNMDVSCFFGFVLL